MSQAEGPEAQVGSSVGDTSQTVFYGVYGLVDCYISKIKLYNDRKNRQNRHHGYSNIFVYVSFG